MSSEKYIKRRETHVAKDESYEEQLSMIKEDYASEYDKEINGVYNDNHCIYPTPDDMAGMFQYPIYYPVTSMMRQPDTIEFVSFIRGFRQQQKEASIAGSNGPGSPLCFMSKADICAGSNYEGLHPGCNLFIFHLPNEVDNWSLFSLFRKFGNVVSARVIIDFRTGLSRGYGFVSFSEPAEAELALLCMDGFRIHGKKLKVSYKRRVPAPEAAESETYSEQTHLEETND